MSREAMSGCERSGSCCVVKASSQRALVLRLVCIQTLVIVVRGDRTKCCLFVLCCPVICCVCGGSRTPTEQPGSPTKIGQIKM